MRLADHLACLWRPATLYSLAAIAGVAMAGDAGVGPPAGMPDVSSFAWPASAVLATFLLRSGGPTFTIRVVTAKDQAKPD